jgi:hypothetical protein
MPLLHTYGVLYLCNTLIPTVETVGYSIWLLAEHFTHTISPVSAELFRSRPRGFVTDKHHFASRLGVAASIATFRDKNMPTKQR